jgi:hypothetical protein
MVVTCYHNKCSDLLFEKVNSLPLDSSSQPIEFSNTEADQRRDAALRHALSTPPRKHEASKKKPKESQLK